MISDAVPHSSNLFSRAHQNMNDRAGKQSERDQANRIADGQQVDLYELIGGSWPPAPRPPVSPDHGRAPRTALTMQRSLPSERVKSVNPLRHLAHDRRRAARAPPAPPASRAPKPTANMVHEPNKVETGLLVDVCGGESRGGAVYDTPAPGSPRVLPVPPAAHTPAPVAPAPRAPSPARAPLVADAELGVGSLVQVATDVDHNYYGVVRWIGSAEETLYAGVELEDEAPGLGDGAHGGERLFSCAPGRALFVPLALCHRDQRFSDSPEPPSHHRDPLTQPESGAVPGAVPPLSGLAELAGKNRGIQGHHNSCYLDATLFAMFTFTSVFDALLFRPREPEDSPHYTEVQRVLREEIVNPLRRHRYVRADRVMRLRTLLERLSDISGLTSEEKDPEEFLNSLVAQILRAEPFLKLSSGQEAYCYQLFVEKDENASLPTVQQLLEQSLATSGVKLREVPSALIVQMPRFGKQYKLYPRLLPSPLLDVTDLIEDLPRQCTVCGGLARWECAACAGRCGAGLESTAFCTGCLRAAHATRAHHQAVALVVSEECGGVLESCPVPRVYMELFAVLCIETSHYVAFAKSGAGHDAPWCFFDSMADRRGEQNGYNIPEIVALDVLNAWLSEEGARALHAAAPLDRQLPPHAKRLLCDAYMCLYRSPDVAMYR